MMKHFACVGPEGVVMWIGSGPAGAAAAQQPVDGHTIEMVEPEVQRGWIREGDAFVPPPVAVRTLDDRRATRREQAQVYRTTTIVAGCMTPKGRVQTDEVSQASILQAMFRAQLAISMGETWSIDWLMEDNSVASHDAGEMIAMGLAVGAWKTACFAASVPILEEIKASDDPDGIDITAGYPTEGAA